VPLLLAPSDAERPEGPLHDAIRRHLADRGASFFADLYVAAEGGPQEPVLDALWDLVWAGEVTNDTMAPLRALLAGGTGRRRGRGPALPSAAPPAGSGRWYLVDHLLAGDDPIAPETRAKAVAEQLLERYGVVTRDAVLSESVPGGFAGLYPVLAAMEDIGAVRRGYFVEGCGGSQFAVPGAVDRLRAAADTGLVVLAATDPANAYGAGLAWPEHAGGLRPARRTGARVVLDAGRLLAWVDRGGRTVLTFGADADTVAAGLVAVGHQRGSGRRRHSIEKIDGEPAAATAVGAALLGNGFVPGYRGLSFPPGGVSPRSRGA
jgi:ATP-dependent Lhr-like helicase